MELGFDESVAQVLCYCIHGTRHGWHVLEM